MKVLFEIVRPFYQSCQRYQLSRAPDSNRPMTVFEDSIAKLFAIYDSKVRLHSRFLHWDNIAVAVDGLVRSASTEFLCPCCGCQENRQMRCAFNGQQIRRSRLLRSVSIVNYCMWFVNRSRTAGSEDGLQGGWCS
jgi:hypothetical protein